MNNGKNSRSWLDTPLLHFSEGNPFTIAQSFEGILSVGQTGAGKTTGPGRALLLAMMQHGYGLLIHTAKRGEADLYREYARLAGRDQDVRIVGADGRFRTNILDYLYRPPESRGRGLTDVVVSTISTLLEMRDRQRGPGLDPFWQDSSKLLMGSAIDVLGISGSETISFENMHQMVASAPYSPEEVRSAEWQQKSYLNRLVDKALSRNDLTEVEKNDLGVALDFWMSEFPRQDERTRSGIITTVTSMTHSFRRGMIGGLCGSTTNLKPEDIFAGAIVILDTPVKEYLEIGQFFQTLWRLMFMRAAERRDLAKYPNPVGLFADEAHLFLTKEDALFAATARSARVANVILTQNIDSIKSRFTSSTGSSEAEALMGNFNLKVFCANDHVPTNEWASKMIGEEWQLRSNVNASLGNDQRGTSASTNEQRRFLVDPIEFMRLKKGGTEHGSMVESIVFRSGRTFADGLNHHRVLFPQDLT